MSNEFRELLVEISQKDWEKELESYRVLIVEKKVDQYFKRDFDLKNKDEIIPWALWGVFLGFVIGTFVSSDAILMGLGVFISTLSFTLVLMLGPLGVFAGILFFAISSVLLSLFFLFLNSLTAFSASLFGGVISALIGGFSGVILHQLSYDYLNKEEIEEKKDVYFDENRDYILSPQELLGFWEGKIQNYLHAQKYKITERIKDLTKKRTECFDIIKEIKLDRSSGRRDFLIRLEKKLEEMNYVLGDAGKLNVLLQSLEDRFLSKISELKVLVEQQEALEREKIKLYFL